MTKTDLFNKTLSLIVKININGMSQSEFSSRVYEIGLRVWEEYAKENAKKFR